MQLHTPASGGVLAFALLTVLVAEASAQDRMLTLEQAAGRGEGRVSFRGRTPAWRWAPDGVHLVKGRGDDAQWVDVETWEESAPPKTSAGDGERESKRAEAKRAFAMLTELDEKEAGRLVSHRIATTEDGSAAVYEHEGALWFRRAGWAPIRLTNAADGETELEELAPDGAQLAFVRGNDLFVVATKNGRLRAITTSGDDETFNGKLDWVYQEEIYGRGRFKAFWWSPDSARIAFLSLDESDVHEFTVIDHIEEGHFRVKPEVSNYPKAGDPNPRVKLGIAEVGTGAITWADLARYRSDEPLVVNVVWSPTGDRVVFQVQDRIQTWLDLNSADPNTGAVTTIVHEDSKSWVNLLGPPRWLADGTFLWQSERTGWKHLYHYRADGTLIRPVTSGEWAVGRIRHLDEEGGRLWFSGTKDGAINSNLYRIGLDGTGLARLTRGDGYHSASFNAARTHFLDTASSRATMAEVRLCDADGKVLKELGQAVIPALDEYRTSRWELFEIEARDGFALDVAVLKPVPFDASESYPVWLSTYSGPDAPTIRNRWSMSTWNQFLAQQGLIVFNVNVRTASGKGQWTTALGYKRFLVQELADIEDAVEWLVAHPWADAARVGITGYSYGGSMTAFALTHSDKFALGIAGGGVYDWRMYDTIYTERYMSTPQRNLEGYDETSVLKAAKNLKGHLLMHCGVMDDNVHMQNTLQLAYALQKANKPFELMVYPQNRHGVRDSDQRWFSRQMEWSTIREHLGAGRPIPDYPKTPASPTIEASAPSGS